MENKKYKSLFTNILIFAVGVFGSKLISFFLLPIYTTSLTKSEYGIAELVFTTSELIRPFISLAIYNGLLRFGLSKANNKDETFRCASLVYFVGSVVCALIIPFFDNFHEISEWKWYLYAYTMVVFLSKNCLIYLKIKEKNKIYSILSILQAFSLALLNILLLVVYKTGIKGYLLSNILSNMIFCLFSFVLGKMYLSFKTVRINKKLLIEMILYSIPFIANDLSWWLIHSLDKYMISFSLGSDFVGVYSTASKVPLVVSVLSSIFIQAWDISAIDEYETNKEKTEFYSKVFTYFETLVSVFSSLLIVFVRPIMNVYIGNSFHDAIIYIPMLVAATVLSVYASFFGSLLTAAKDSKCIMRSTLIASLLNIILNYIFIIKYKIWGAVLGTFFSYLILMFIRYFRMQDIFMLQSKKSKYFISVLVITLQAIITSFVNSKTVLSIACFLLILIMFKKELIDVSKLALRFCKEKYRKLNN